MWENLVGSFKARAFTWAFLIGALLGGVLPDVVEGTAIVYVLIPDRSAEFKLNNIVLVVGLLGIAGSGFALYWRLCRNYTHGVVKNVTGKIKNKSEE